MRHPVRPSVLQSVGRLMVGSCRRCRDAGCEVTDEEATNLLMKRRGRRMGGVVGAGERGMVGVVAMVRRVLAVGMVWMVRTVQMVLVRSERAVTKE